MLINNEGGYDRGLPLKWLALQKPTRDSRHRGKPEKAMKFLFFRKSSNSQKWRGDLSFIGPVVLFIFLALLIGIRVQLVETRVGSQLSCAGCFDQAVVANDLVMIGLSAITLIR